MSTLKGKVAIVTGASSGIGRGLALGLGAAGMSLILTARRAPQLEALAGELGSAICVPGDITDGGLPQRLIDTAVEKLGDCDVVCSNAGIMDTASIEGAGIDRLCRSTRIESQEARG